MSERFLICILTQHERTGWVSKGLCEWLCDLPYSTPQVEYAITFAHNFIPAAAARNYFCRKVKEMDKENRPTWAVMIDNDMAPRKDLLKAVDNAPADAGVVVPQFQMWDEAKPSVTLCWGMDESVAPMNNGSQRFTIESGKWYPLTKCGTGAIFIRPEIFDKIEMPYFWYPYNQDQGIEGTEDITFSKKVLAAGFKIYGNSIVNPVGHYHNVNLAVLAKYLYGSGESPSAEVDNKGKIEMEADERPSELPAAAACPA